MSLPSLSLARTFGTAGTLSFLGLARVGVPSSSASTATSSSSDYEAMMWEQIRRNREREAKELQAAIVIPRRMLEVAE